jgi:hypothetical protein
MSNQKYSMAIKRFKSNGMETIYAEVREGNFETGRLILVGKIDAVADIFLGLAAPVGECLVLETLN